MAPRQNKKAEQTERTAAENSTIVTLQDFIDAGAEIMNRGPPLMLNSKKSSSAETFEMRWTSHFNAEPQVCLDAWNRLKEMSFDGIEDKNERPEHLLWGLLFLKVYATEPVLSGMCDCDEDTFRLYAWRFVEKISYLIHDVIVWENRLLDNIEENRCKTTVDGVDCLVEGSSKLFYSHKFKHAALRYELAVCIRTGDIVWVNGPFPCGDWPDINIFRHGIKNYLLPGECVEADDGYIGEDPSLVRAPGGVRYMEDQHWYQKRSKARKRHETINQRIKVYGVLTSRFRHEYGKHAMCFRACAVLTQLSFEFGKRGPFEVRNYDETWKDTRRCPMPGDVIPGDEGYEESYQN